VFHRQFSEAMSIVWTSCSSRPAGIRSVTRSRGGGEIQCLMSRYPGIKLYYMSEQGEAPITDDLLDTW